MSAKNRIDHFVWLVEPENLSRYVKQMSELFETTFDEFRNESGGALVLISWDAGLEFTAPYGDSPAANALRAVLAERGEGPCAVVVRVPSVDASSERAAALGWPIDAPQSGYWGELGRQSVELENMSWTTKVTSMRERVIGSFLNTTLLFGEIEYADVEDATS
ncbi:VOC family protein [Nocardia sp. CDC159]|uniref:VOC family protein n=1 Tax=Nocardia pulmonis TaxID=2951408 RepID=A0A9X2E5A0_9NOCA|nr:MULTISPECIES: VOC family protein [Nocardia]MCM6773085.1 VOC family protein [Nocardia pulmonis]MCM6785612.1 VOC family protein [Nocardia sp. CDC159]